MPNFLVTAHRIPSLTCIGQEPSGRTTREPGRRKWRRGPSMDASRTGPRKSPGTSRGRWCRPVGRQSCRPGTGGWSAWQPSQPPSLVAAARESHTPPCTQKSPVARSSTTGTVGSYTNTSAPAKKIKLSLSLSETERSEHLISNLVNTEESLFQSGSFPYVAKRNYRLIHAIVEEPKQANIPFTNQLT